MKGILGIKNTTSKLVFITLFLFGIISTLNLYDNDVSNVVNLNPKNFDSQIIQNRSKNVISIVHFYSLDGILNINLDGKSRGIKLEFEKFSSETDGLFKSGAVNCKQFKDICERYDAKEFPVFKIFPPLPSPVFIYEVIYISYHFRENLKASP